MNFTIEIFNNKSTDIRYAGANAHSTMAYERDDFDRPVQDYDLRTTETISDLLRQMEAAGGFTATKLIEARNIIQDAIAETKDSAGENKVLNWLSFPACLMATGTRGFFHEAVRSQAYNVISTTCGTLDHDIARTFRDYYHGSFDLDDVLLGNVGLKKLKMNGKH